MAHDPDHGGTRPAPAGPAFDVVVVGSANLDLVAAVRGLPRPGETVLAGGYAEHPGGKGLNQAVACARMGARTAFVGCVGDDAAGDALRAVLVGEGVDVGGLLTVADPTGRAFITVDERGDNVIVVVPGANDRVEAAVAAELPAATVVLLQLEIPLASAAAVAAAGRSRGATVVLDPAPAPDRALAGEALTALLRAVDVVVPNAGEAAALGGAAGLHDAGPAVVITTRGASGADISTGGTVTTVPAHPVVPLDTVGAGDAFTGALATELARGVDPATAVRTAVVAGALATTVAGAAPSLPTRAAVEAAMTARPATAGHDHGSRTP